MSAVRRFILRNDPIKERAADFVRTFQPANDGDIFECVVRKVKSKRTLEQNAYLHKLFSDIADFTGDTKKEIKFLMKAEMLEPVFERKLPNGNTMVEYPSTADMSVKELTEFAERVEAFAITELGFVRGQV